MKILHQAFKPKIFNITILTIVNTANPIFVLLLGIIIKSNYDVDKDMWHIFWYWPIYVLVPIITISVIYNNLYNKYIKNLQEATEDEAQINMIKRNGYEQLNKNLIKSIKSGDNVGVDQTIEFIQKIRKGIEND